MVSSPRRAGRTYTHNLCPQHTSEWIADAANPESEQWVGA